MCAWVICRIPGWGHRPGLCWPAIVGVGGFSGGELAGIPNLHLWGESKKRVRGIVGVS